MRGLTNEERAFLTLPSGSNLDGYGHDLTRGAFGTEELLDRYPECMELKSVVDGIGGGSWRHLSPALPEPITLPEVCSLSRTEFIKTCARHVRLLLAESTIVQFWTVGDYVRTDRAAPPWRMPFQNGATP